ncbi:hypothetical protein AAY473_011674 [Plecturocebus cupreus]
MEGSPPPLRNSAFDASSVKSLSKCLDEDIARPGAVAHVCNLSALGGQGRKIACVQEFETSLGNIARSVSTKNKLARCGGVHLWSQLLGRLRREDHLSPGGQGCIEMGFHPIGQADLKVLTSSEPPTLASQSAGIIVSIKIPKRRIR